MHLGHAWVAWHNYSIAAGSGGRFTLIVDDIMYYMPHLAQQSWPVVASVERYVEDLTWLGLVPDDVVYSTRNAETHAEAANKLGIRRPARLTYTWWGTCVPDATGTGASNQYNAWLVAVRVVDDYLAGIDSFVRGQDLIEEMYLYDDTCRRLGYRPCGQQYVPLVRREASAAKESKSAGALSIREYRAAGYTPAELIGTLRECARRSETAGLRDVVIPAGVLELEPRKALRYSIYQTTAVIEAANEGLPWQDAVVAHHRRMKQRERNR